MGSMHMYDRDATIGFRTWEYTVLIDVLSSCACEKCTRTRESSKALAVTHRYYVLILTDVNARSTISRYHQILELV
jgi:hypothetical protein